MNALKYNKIHIIKYNYQQVSNSYMFWHQSAILGESTRKKKIQLQHTNLGVNHPQWYN